MDLGTHRGRRLRQRASDPAVLPGRRLRGLDGFDPYNFAGCSNQPWRSFSQTLDTFYDWTAANGLGSKPLLAQEFGTTYDPADPAASTAWSAGIPAALAAHPRIKAVVRWDADTECTLRIDSGRGMVESFKSAGLAVPRP